MIFENLARCRWSCLTCLLAMGCLKPQAQHGDLYSSFVLPPNATVKTLESDQATAKKLDANDGLSGMSIPLHSAFVGSKTVQYWDFGQLTAISVKPMWIFRERGDDDTAKTIDHPNLIDAIPGDTPYTPLRQVYVVFVTDNYRGERITSLRALEDAVELGLVEAPVAQDHFVNCPVTLSTMQLQNGDGEPVAPEPVYYHGLIVYQFCIGGFLDGVGAFMLKDGAVTAGNAYVLRRENESQILDEALFKADLNEDGDMIDTNVVFDSNVGEMGYASVWRNIEVVVPRSYEFGSAKAVSDLLEKKPGGLAGILGRVISYKDSGVFLNRPIQRVGPQQVMP